jgi:hypothetical protein
MLRFRALAQHCWWAGRTTERRQKALTEAFYNSGVVTAS